MPPRSNREQPPGSPRSEMRRPIGKEPTVVIEIISSDSSERGSIHQGSSSRQQAEQSDQSDDEAPRQGQRQSSPRSRRRLRRHSSPRKDGNGPSAKPESSRMREASVTAPDSEADGLKDEPTYDQDGNVGAAVTERNTPLASATPEKVETEGPEVASAVKTPSRLSLSNLLSPAASPALQPSSSLSHESPLSHSTEGRDGTSALSDNDEEMADRKRSPSPNGRQPNGAIARKSKSPEEHKVSSAGDEDTEMRDGHLDAAPGDRPDGAPDDEMPAAEGEESEESEQEEGTDEEEEEGSEDEDEEDEASEESEDDDGEERDLDDHTPRKRRASDASATSGLTPLPQDKALANGDGEPTDKVKDGGERAVGKVGAALEGVAAGDGATVDEGAGAPKKRRRLNTPSPPPGPPPAPPRPTIRMTFQIGQPKSNEDLAAYLFDVPTLVLEKLREHDDAEARAYVTWYEQYGDAARGMQVAVPELAVVPAGPATGPGTSTPNAEGTPMPGPEDDLDPQLRALLARHQEPKPGAGPAKKKRRRRNELETYDVNDPFVDDAELQIDEPTHAGKPKKIGFYVEHGDVELETKTRKRRSAKEIAEEKAAAVANAAPMTAEELAAHEQRQREAHAERIRADRILHLGVQMRLDPVKASNSLIVQRVRRLGITVDMGTSVSGSATNWSDVDADGQKQLGGALQEWTPPNPPQSDRRQWDRLPIPMRLCAAFDELLRLVDREPFAVKTQFPRNLKAPLVACARLALELDAYDEEHFFNYLPEIFPYNRFTMHKLVKREMCQPHIEYLDILQNEYIAELHRLVEAALPAQTAEYESLVRSWNREAESRVAAAIESFKREREAAVQAGQPDEGPPTQMDIAAVKVKAEKMGEPEHKWQFTEEMRYNLLVVILLEDAKGHLSNDKADIEKRPDDKVNETTWRKSIYKRLSDHWPASGWVVSTTFSKEFATLKRRFDKVAAAAGAGAAVAATIPLGGAAPPTSGSGAMATSNGNGRTNSATPTAGASTPGVPVNVVEGGGVTNADPPATVSGAGGAGSG